MLNFLDFYVGIGAVYTNWPTLIFGIGQFFAVSGVVAALNTNIKKKTLGGVSMGIHFFDIYQYKGICNNYKLAVALVWGDECRCDKRWDIHDVIQTHH